MTGAQGYRFGHGQDFDNVHHFGYPANGYERDDLTGDDLWYCEGSTEDAGLFSEDILMQCDMTQGASDDRDGCYRPTFHFAILAST